MTSSPSIRIALLGCGTVGSGVLTLLEEHRAELNLRLGGPIEVVGVAARRTSGADREAVAARYRLTDDVEGLVSDPAVQVVVEVMGGTDAALHATRAALAAGKHVVTANKAMLAAHGSELFGAAAAAGLDLMYEASVGGGVPVIRALRESLASDRVRTLTAINNGTSNFVLSRMADDGLSFDAAVAEAQAMGYAEADPSADVDGHDAAQKLAILSALAFGRPLDAPVEDVVGIRDITAADLQRAQQFGYRVRPLAVASVGRSGAAAEVDTWVGPALVPHDHLLATVHGVHNAFLLQSDGLGPLLLVGQGAGMMATAVSVVSDIVEVGRNVLAGTSARLPPLAWHEHLRQRPVAAADPAARMREWYLRFAVADRPGVLGRLATALGAHGVSIRRMEQPDVAVHKSKAGAGSDRDPAYVVMLTHAATAGAVRGAVAAIDDSEVTLAPTLTLPVEGASPKGG